MITEQSIRLIADSFYLVSAVLTLVAVIIGRRRH